MSEPKPSPGARKAARLIQGEQQIYDPASFPLAQSATAQIIEDCTHCGDLLEALERLIRAITARNGEIIPVYSEWDRDALFAARKFATGVISKAKGES